MRNVVLLILMLQLGSLSAQQLARWKGGTPGRESCWHEARNWSTYRVPDEHTQVVIKRLHTGHYAQPVIDQPVEVASIEIHAGACLRVKPGGEIRIDGEYQYTQGIVTYGGSLVNEGVVSMKGVEGFSLKSLALELRDGGWVEVDGEVVEPRLLVKE